MKCIWLARLFLACVFLAYLVGCNSSQPSASGSPRDTGTTSSGGGTSVELEFKSLIRNLIKEANLRNPDEWAPFEMERWPGLIQSVQIETSMQPLTLKEGASTRTVNALNFPKEKRICVYLPAWEILSMAERQTLALHEWFGLLVIGDKQYESTNRFMQKIDLVSRLDFTSIQITGPLADALVKHLHWTSFEDASTLSADIPELRTEAILATQTTRTIVLDCVFRGGNPEQIVKMFKLPSDFYPLNTKCGFQLAGTLIGGSQLNFNIDDGAEDGETLWQALDGTPAVGFEYPSIHGIIPPTGHKILKLDLSPRPQ